MNQQENQQYWNNQAKQFVGHDVSWWDTPMKKMEIEELIPWLIKTDYVLDVGCSNGSSTVEIAKKTQCRIRGIDYSPMSIEQARQHRHDEIHYEVADIRTYDHDTLFDKVYSIRTLINLMTKQDQYLALEKIHSLLKPGGQYLMLEAFMDGLRNLNSLREKFKLPPLPEPEKNLYFRAKEFERAIRPYFKIIEIKYYASLYYIGTRVFQYVASTQEPLGQVNAFNEYFSRFNFSTEHSGDFSPQRFYVLEKI